MINAQVQLSPVSEYDHSLSHREEQIMNDRRVCVCYERGAMVEHCHLHDLPEADAERLMQELNRERGYPRYWIESDCPDGDESIFHYRGGY